jgi:hypothetical protein
MGKKYDIKSTYSSDLPTSFQAKRRDPKSSDNTEETKVTVSNKQFKKNVIGITSSVEGLKKKEWRKEKKKSFLESKKKNLFLKKRRDNNLIWDIHRN